MKRTLCILLSLMLAVTGLVGLAVPAGAIGYKVGDIIELGSYPQTLVKDESLIEALGNAPKTWDSYDCYTGTGNLYDGQMQVEDWMQKYCDVTYNGQKYRGFYIIHYRPSHTGTYDFDLESDSYQDDNGYKPFKTFWFLYEPLKWRVLDANTGLVMSESIIDSQAFNNYVLKDGTDPYGKPAYWGNHLKTSYANNYSKSSLRAWLNADFRDTAFSEAQLNVIKSTYLQNSAINSEYSAYQNESTSDKVFPLSVFDLRNTAYGFHGTYDQYEDPARKAQGTDYAKSRGLQVSSKGYSSWHVRTPGLTSLHSSIIADNGGLYYNGETDLTDVGVRPAITVDLHAYNVYLLKSAQLSVPQSATVGYKSTVTVTATASGLPDGYFVALYEDDVAMLQMDGDNTTVTYKMNKMTESRTLTAKVIDVDGNVQSNADGKLEKTITITVKTGFFDKVKAFFLGLFGLLPKITLNP